MRNIQYGWRHSTNLIEDVKPAYTVVPDKNDRGEFDNFRPFEELADNFKVRRHYANEKRTPILVDFKHTYMPVSVTQYQPFKYTSVPPLSTLSIPGFDTNHTTYDAISDKYRSASTSAGVLVSKTSAAFRTHIVKPLAVAAAAVVSFLFGRRYTAKSGLQHYWRTALPAFAKPMLAIAGFSIGVFLLAQVVSSNNAGPGSNNGNNAGSSTSNSQNDASRAVTAPQDVPSSPPSQTGMSTSGSGSDTAAPQPLKPQSSQSTGTYWDLKAPTTTQSTGSGSTSPQQTLTAPSSTGGESPTSTTGSSWPTTNTSTSAPAPAPTESTSNSEPVPEVTEPTSPLQILDTTLQETEGTLNTLN